MPFLPVCKSIPETIPRAWVAIPNPVFIICVIVTSIMSAFAQVPVLIAEMVHNGLAHSFELATASPGREIDTNYWVEGEK